MRLWAKRAALVFALSAGPALAQQAPAVHYDVSFPNAAHHEARISVTYRGIGERPLALRMSRSSPGRYALHEFAKNVYSVSAVDSRGRALPVTRSDPYQWTVAGHDGTATVTYTLYADRADGTYSQIDPTHAHLNMPATFMWARGFEDRPISVTFRPVDSSWKAATQLRPTTQPWTFAAPNLQYFMDSPTELSDHEVREWQVADADGRYTIRLAVHHPGGAEEVDRFAERARRVVAQQIELFRDVPNFDFGTYTFLADYVPQASGDGMEHRNSTYITSPQSLAQADYDQLGTLSHEFFHAWNVERLRPRDLEPFDFERANPTTELWFSEGFTSYYGPLMIRRAGLSTVDAFLEELSGTLNYVVNSPGRRFGSPQDMSLRAPFEDAATAIDPTNSANVFVSYYPYGAVIALALDMTMRQRFRSLSLDDYMRQLWRSHGAPERPFTAADLKAGLATVTRDPRFADTFFSQSIERSGLPDFGPLLDQAGLKLRRAHAGGPYLGPVSLNVADQAVTIAGATRVGTPIYEAGLDRGHEVVSLGGTAIDSREGWAEAVARLAPGQRVGITYRQRGGERTATLIVAEDPALEIVRYETAGLTPSAAQLAFRNAWLGPEARADQ